MTEVRESSFYTKVVHAGENPRAFHGAINTPIYNSAVFAFSDADEAWEIHTHRKAGYFYGRLGNPTQEALERAMATIEDGEDALAVASGMAAISMSILSLVKAGDHIVAPISMYSTTTLLLKELEKFGVEVSFIESADAQSYENSIKDNTRLFWIETPSNPLLNITDLGLVAEIAKRHNIITIVDNTFATPFNQKPISYGIDLVVHSATKYLGGHSDLTAGIIIGKREFIESMRHHSIKLYGGSIAPQVAWLVLRGIKTLAIRMEKHNNNAFAIANMLSNHPKVPKVYYPGLSSHQNYDIALRQMRGFGGIISFDLGSVESGKRMVNNVKLCTLGTSLGGVETLIQHSASMTHAALSREERLKAGISDGLIRLSVGIEDVNDLIDDLNQALEKC